MSFKSFIYYCALCGGWAALAAWAVVQFAGIVDWQEKVIQAAVTAGLVGLLVAFAIGVLDAKMNAVGFQRIVRVLLCLMIGLIGGLLGGLLGGFLYETFGQQMGLLVAGWVLIGILIGASVGIFDLIRARVGKQASSAPRRKTINGILGGALGGLLGGILYGNMQGIDSLPRSGRAIGLVLLGLMIGLMIGLAQVMLKEAWVKVEQGFRPGREMMLTKDETTIGRAEACDVGLFGDNQVDRTHARIVIQGNRYVLTDADSTSGTYLNDQRIGGPTPLSSGDRIRVGRNVLRFGERQRR
jgi:MFS family permease